MSVSGGPGVRRLRLAEPRELYDRQAETFANVALERADRGNFKHFEDVELANNERLILVSSNGTRYKVVVSDAGVLSASSDI